MTIGQRIAAARKAAGLTQEQLAKLAGVTKSAVSQIENGTTKSPKPETLFLLADALRVDARAMVFGGDSTPKDRRQDQLTSEERTLIKYFRRMPPDKQKAFVGHAMIVRIYCDSEARAESRARFDRRAMAEATRRKNQAYQDI